VIRRAGWLAGCIAWTACGKAPTPLVPAPVAVPVAVPAAVPDTVSPEAPTPPPPPVRRFASVRLALVGDINLGTTTLPDGIPPDQGRGFLDLARPFLVGDRVIGNFEGVLADTGTSVKCERNRSRRHPRLRPEEPADSAGKRSTRSRRRMPADTIQPPGCYVFRTPTALAPRLAEAGFTHLHLANNHANDFGTAGRASTEALLDALGLRFYGPLGRIAIDTVARGDSLTIVGLVGFTTYPFAYNLLDLQRSAEVVDSIRGLVDLLVVTFHGGSEGAGAVHTSEVAESLGREPRGDLRRWARAVVDAGADAVVGHGPHVLRGIEFYRGVPIVYSLGNFATYRGFNLAGPLGVTGVLQLEYDPDRRLRHARLIPMLQRPRAGPALDSTAQALDLVRRLSWEDFGSTAALISADGEILPPDR